MTAATTTEAPPVFWLAMTALNVVSLSIHFTSTPDIWAVACAAFSLGMCISRWLDMLKKVSAR